ncbi:MAG: hypothetical protein AVDCRST_MAG13-139, partial [uncultured Solirubrobacteraceae bacterium]
ATSGVRPRGRHAERHDGRPDLHGGVLAHRPRGRRAAVVGRAVRV